MKPMTDAGANLEHPYFKKYGRFPGQIIMMNFGTHEQMVEVTLNNCSHGTTGYFVGKDDVGAR